MASRLSEAFRSHPVNLTHKQLDFSSLINELPESHAWTKPDEYPSREGFSSDETVPIVDLKDSNALNLISYACKTWGIFQVTNHGVPIKLLHDVESVGSTLFSLPAQLKLKAARSPDGASGYGLARISSFFPKLMWSEGFTIVGSPLEHFHQLWPQNYSKYCDIIEEYEMEMKNLAGRLMCLMLSALGVSESDIKWGGQTHEGETKSAALQLNYYPICPDPDRAMGLAAHTDSTLLTILYQNSISGLQVLKEDIGWVTVPPVDGALIINVGDLLQILSNGLYTSVLHRAIVNRTQCRLSVAYLHGPPDSAQISPISRLVDPTHPPLYKPVTWNEYLGTKAIHFNKALSSVRLFSLINGLCVM